jgi:hypothetical protein
VANTLSFSRNGAVGFIDWLDGSGIPPRALALKVPFPVRDFNLCDVRWIERDVSVSTDFANDGMMRDRNIANHAAIAESNSNDLVVHSRLGLIEQKLAPLLRQRGHDISWMCDNGGKCTRKVNAERVSRAIDRHISERVTALEECQRLLPPLVETLSLRSRSVAAILIGMRTA